MRRLWLLPVAAALLGACGTLGTPEPTAGDLLAAPTTLQVGGRSLRAEATPTLGDDTFQVRVRVQAKHAPIPVLKVTGVYVVTEDGVWNAPVGARDRKDCGDDRCLQGTGRGAAEGLRSGEGVQVVVSLKDEKGRVLWLRDARASIQ
ncbi:hypothetical protein DAETH_22090 [Deinococcus aetherius]|uniref:Lipoprotein n=1 Tax=Deinococcus aetherius TaxID=200252 RepID=A0ABM8AEM2_9DEIO|nr:hypothetical protein [Deinococcus aetherius]BDP42240.1 hypothetical protein DAETH_22090 [Deinococcus aetherius]